MASSNRVLSVIFMLSLLHSYNAAPSKLVHDFCGTVDNPGTCISALQLDPKSATVENYHDLLVITLNLAIANTTNSKDFLVATKGKFNPVAMKACIEGFEYAVRTFRSALSGVDEDPESAGYDSAVAHDGAAECVTGFQSAKINVPTEISTRVGYVELYSNFANKITDHMY
ncbi:hypothetical protein ACFE04_023748 [Oxalis oulophora]